jgi:drug/metabolite transporter (DMT)-like permease
VLIQENHFENVPWSAWLGFAYVSLISMFAAFYFWYSGLARAGVVRASQVQLLQPLLSVFWAFLFLNEPISVGLLFAAAGTIAAVAFGVRRARPRARRMNDSFEPMSQAAE